MKYGILILIIFSLLINACGLSILSGTGTHGSLGAYTYLVPKEKLETEIKSIISSNDRIQELKTDGKEYTSIIIKTDIPYYFVFRYTGDKEYWESHPNESQISISAIKKANGEYKSEGEINKKERNEAIKIFEEYFIAKIDESGLQRKKE